ncbi:MAG: hypothetical protein J7M25_06645 [Deltaproteobacteria bacterium]|nr:hypothetical protein [Deltaproteobacteria bacterium]
MKERRNNRTNDQLNALRLMMDATVQRFGLLGLVLADDEGLMVAASSPLIDPEEMAAVSPLLVRNPDAPEPFDWPLEVWRVNTNEANLQFCAIGEHRSVAAATLKASRAVRRILEL